MFCIDRLTYAYELLRVQFPALLAFEFGLICGFFLAAAFFLLPRGRA